MFIIQIILNPRVVAIFGFIIFTVLSKVSAYPPDPQPDLKLGDSQSPFGLVTRSFATHGTPTTTVELALTALSTPSSTLPPTSGASTLTTSSSFLSFSSFSSFPSVDPVLTSRLSLNPTTSIRPNLDPLDSPLELTATPLSTTPTPLTPQLSEQVPFSPPLDSQTASLPTEFPRPSTDARVLSPGEHSTTTVNNNFVIGMVFASMFAFMILCLLILQCSRWYRSKRTSFSSPNLARSGSSSNSPATEKRKWMRGTLFDVETGMVENLAGIGRAARELFPFRGKLIYSDDPATSYGTRETWLQRWPSNNSSSYAIPFLQRHDPECTRTAQSNNRASW